jgi:hypothetical protein
MATFLGSVNGLNAKNIMNMGIVRKEKNGNRVAISYEDPYYSVRGFKNGNHFWNDFTTFKEAKSFFNAMYKSF